MNLIRKMKSEIALTIEPNLAHPHQNFHDSFSPVLVFAQFFGLMPLHGITSKNSHDVKFEFKSLRFFYSCYNIVGAFVVSIFCIAKFAIDGLMLDKTGVCVCAAHFIFLIDTHL